MEANRAYRVRSARFCLSAGPGPERMLLTRPGLEFFRPGSDLCHARSFKGSWSMVFKHLRTEYRAETDFLALEAYRLKVAPLDPALYSRGRANIVLTRLPNRSIMTML